MATIVITTMAGTTPRGVITIAAGTTAGIGTSGIATRGTMATEHTGTMVIVTGCTVAGGISGTVVIMASPITFTTAAMSGAIAGAPTRTGPGTWPTTRVSAIDGPSGTTAAAAWHPGTVVGEAA